MYFQSENSTAKLASLLEGFLLEVDRDGIVVVLVKVDAAKLASLLGGCKIEFVIGSPKNSRRSTIMIIYDRIDAPFQIRGQELSLEDEEYLGIDKVSVSLINSEKIRIVYFNLLNYQILSTTVEKQNDLEKFRTWYGSSSNSAAKGSTRVPQASFRDTSFLIKISNKDFSNENKITTFGSHQLLDVNQELPGVQNYQFDNYISNGRHGQNQEISIGAGLGRFFSPDKDLFFSPKYNDGNELTDFLIIGQGAVLIIESKYVISQKSTKYAQAIAKAIKQLKRASWEIGFHPESFSNEEAFFEELKSVNRIYRICIVHDTHIISESLEEKICSKHTKEELPIFISIDTFLLFIGITGVKSGVFHKGLFFQKFFELYEAFLKSSRQVLILEFDPEEEVFVF